METVTKSQKSYNSRFNSCDIDAIFNIKTEDWCLVFRDKIGDV